MIDDVIKRLATLGYAVNKTADKWLINFLIKEVVQTIKNECNTPDVPDGLYYVAVEMVCGEVLAAKKGTGALDTLDAEAAIKSIKEGDTQITYAIPDTGVTLDGLLELLRNCGRGQFATYRRFVW